jgi:hypothetical protein
MDGAMRHPRRRILCTAALHCTIDDASIRRWFAPRDRRMLFLRVRASHAQSGEEGRSMQQRVLSAVRAELEASLAAHLACEHDGDAGPWLGHLMQLADRVDDEVLLPRDAQPMLNVALTAASCGSHALPAGSQPRPAAWQVPPRGPAPRRFEAPAPR